MEFLEYNQALKELRAIGVVERADGELRRFGLDLPNDSDVTTLVFAPEQPGDLNGARFVKMDTDKLPEFVERVCHANHIPEVMVIPAGIWRKIIDLIAFDLAADSAWLEIDAEASLHQNGRDPLLVNSADMHVIRAMTSALIEHADDAEDDVTVAPTQAPMIFEFRCKGELEVVCPSAAIADEIEDIASH